MRQTVVLTLSLVAILAAACGSRNADLAEGSEPIGARRGGASHGGGGGGGGGSNDQALPPGHPPMGGDHAQAGDMPAGHPPIGDTAQGGGDMPAGHPAIGDTAQGGGDMPAGHPTVGDTAGAGPAAAPGEPVAGGVRWTPPESFVSERPASSMRAAQYRVPRAAGDEADGQLAVFYFGPGQGGAVQDNIDRWVGQVEQPDGRPSSEVAHTERRTVNGMTVTVVSVLGRIGGGSGMPGMPPAPRIERGQLLGAIVEGPQGPVFFKLTGPATTLGAARSAFDALIGSFRSAG